MKLAVSTFAAVMLLLTMTNEAAASMPRQLRAGETTLTLNGWGARSNSVLKLYHGGLYLPQPNSDAATIIAADEPMAIRIQITSVFVKQAKLDESLRTGLHKSTGGHTKPISAEIAQFRKCFAEQITKGDVFQMVYQPGTGVVVSKNGRRKGIVQGLAFKQALFGIWLGENPADLALKRSMLQNHKVAGGADAAAR